MKEMTGDFVRGVSLAGYGCSLMVGIGIPIPILNEDLAYFTGLTDDDIFCPVVDYGEDYPSAINRTLGRVSYGELKSGMIEIMGKKIPASPLSSYPVAKKIAGILKGWVENGFTLGAPQIQTPTAQFKKGLT